MRIVIPLVLVLLLPPFATAPAGPNEGVVLAVQGNVDGMETSGDRCVLPLPDRCADLVPTASPDSNGAEWFLLLAVREPEPLSFTAVAFGVGDYDTGSCYIAVYGPCYPSDGIHAEDPDPDWPLPESGTFFTWTGDCAEGTIVPVYHFAVYAYGPGQIPLGPFTSDWPPEEHGLIQCSGQGPFDPFEEYAVIGCGGAEGYNPCPPTPISTRSTTWGQIKAIYR